MSFWKRFNKLFKSKTDKGVDPLKDDTKGIVTENSEIEQKLFSTFFESKHLIAANFDDLFYEEVTHIYEEIKSTNHETSRSNENIQELRAKLNEEITIKEIKRAIKNED